MQPKLLLEEIARAVQLREGPMGVQALLWNLAWKQPISTKEWAGTSRLPIPVVAAIRGELVQRGLMREGRRPSPTPEGNHFLRELFGESCDLKCRCPVCEGSGLVIPGGLHSVLEEFSRICSNYYCRLLGSPFVDEHFCKLISNPDSFFITVFFS